MKNQFLGIGFPRCGTTFLYDSLNAPNGVPKPFYKEQICSLFEPLPAECIDFTPFNIYMDIGWDLTEANVIICVRDPIERALSVYYHAEQKGILDDRMDLFRKDQQIVEKIIQGDTISESECLWVKDFGLMSGSIYEYWINRFKGNHNPANLLIVDFQTVIRQRQELKKSLSVLGLTISEKPTRNANFRSTARSRFVSDLVFKSFPGRSYLKAILPQVFRRNLLRAIAIANKKPLVSDTDPRDIKEQILLNYEAPLIRAIEKKYETLQKQ